VQAHAGVRAKVPDEAAPVVENDDGIGG